MKRAQVVVLERNTSNLFSKLIAAVTKSKASHCFIVVGDDRAVEASFPRVHAFTISERLKLLRDEGRAYAVLDLPGIADEERNAIAKKALSYRGRLYDVWQLLIYFVTGKFYREGTGTLICSRLITASYQTGAQETLFPAALIAKLPKRFARRKNLSKGYAIPGDFFFSRLAVTDFVPSPDLTKMTDFYPAGE